MKKINNILLTIIILLTSITGTVHAEEPATVNLTLRSGNTIIFTGEVSLPTSTTELQGQLVNPNSTLAVLNDADFGDSLWSISDLQYFESFGSFYLKCITSSVGNDCDNWQYTVNDIYPGISMDQNILSGGESVYIYFGPQNKITLNSNTINTTDTLTVTAQTYDYQNNGWKNRTAVTVGLTQINPDDQWSPIEVLTNAVDGSGQTTFFSVPAGSYNVGIKEDFYFPTETLTVTIPAPIVPEPTVQRQSSGRSYIVSPIPTPKKTFDFKKAFDFIIVQQKENGSFGEDIYTDWTALALASGNYQEQTLKVVKYFGEFKMEGASLTDYERHAMALLALGLNPYNIYPASGGASGENYIAKITTSFDGKQFGDVNEDNDDIFALIVLQNAGFTQTDQMIVDDVSFVLSKQRENGSWDYSVDMTSAGIQALAFFQENVQVKNALIKAREFLKQNQKDTGGWENVSSTAWAIGGILALSEKPEDWIKNNNTPLDYLAVNQDADGGMKNFVADAGSENTKNRIWETAYTISALSGKTWNQVMQKFRQPKTSIEIGVSVKIKKIETKKIIKTEPPQNTSPSVKKLKNSASRNLANPLQAITNVPIEEKIPEPVKKKSWLRTFFEIIFGF